MRQVHTSQLELGAISIDRIDLNLDSRDDIPAILLGLQHLYRNPEMRTRGLGPAEAEMIPNVSLDIGRPGMVRDRAREALRQRRRRAS